MVQPDFDCLCCKNVVTGFLNKVCTRSQLLLGMEGAHLDSIFQGQRIGAPEKAK